MSLSIKIISTPPIDQIVLKILKSRIYKPYQITLAKVLEKQEKMLEKKLRQIQNTDIGRSIGIQDRVKLEALSITDYKHYEPFFNSPSPSAFVFPLKEYTRVMTSGTSGKEKWFMIPKKKLRNSWKTGIASVLTIFHDGEKIALDCGDVFYVNAAPRPFISGSSLSVGGGKTPFFKIVPNYSLSFREKVQYFINHCEKIDGASLLASSLISEIIPSVRKPIKLKGLHVTDSTVGELYKDEIERFTGTYPKAVYGSTETGFCSVPSVQHKFGFFFDWQHGIVEFLSTNKEITTEKPISIDKVRVGEIYRLIYTDFISELTRYDTKDSFKCVGKGDEILGIDCPIFKFHSRLDKTISLQNFTRISEEELLMALKGAKLKFVDFTARVKIENGVQYLAIYMEQIGDKTAGDIQMLIHEQLYKQDETYRKLVDFFEYMPIKVYLLKKGIFVAYLQEKAGSVPKVDRINMEQQEFKKFEKLMA